MSIDKGSEETYRHLNPEYCKLTQMPEDASGEVLSAQNRENIPTNSLDTRMKRRGFLKLLGGVAAGVLASNTPVAKGLEAAAIKVEQAAKKVKEALTASEAFINLAIKDPVNTYVQVSRDHQAVTDPQGNFIGLRVVAKYPDQSYQGWYAFDSLSSNGMFPEFSPQIGPFSTADSVSTFHMIENGSFKRAIVSYDGGIKVLTQRAGLNTLEVKEIQIDGGVPSKVVYPEKGKIVYATRRVIPAEKLAVYDINANDIVAEIPVQIDGAMIDLDIMKGKDGNIYCSALNPQRHPFGYLKIILNLDNLTITGERRHADVRSDSFYLDQSGAEEKALLYDHETSILRIYNESTNADPKFYPTSGILNNVPGAIEDFTQLSTVISGDGRIYASMTNGSGARFLVSWPDNVNPNDHPELVSYINVSKGLIAPEWGGGSVSSIQLVKRDGKRAVLIKMTYSYKGVVYIELNDDGSVNKDALKYMLGEGLPKDVENQATSTPTSTPTNTQTPTPELTATPTSTPTSTPTNTPTPVEQPKQRVFIPLVTRAN